MATAAKSCSPFCSPRPYAIGVGTEAGRLQGWTLSRWKQVSTVRC